MSSSVAAQHSADWKQTAPAYLAGASAATSLVSIAASQILLGTAIVALWFSPRPLRWPRAGWPLMGFLGWTVVSLAASPDPWDGLPQIKKFYVYLMLWVVVSAVRQVSEVRWIVLGWAAGGALSALWSFVQYGQKYLQGGEYFYLAYSNDRVTGFMDHWMTFSGTMMLGLMMAGALFLFDRPNSAERSSYRRWVMAAIVLMGAALLIGFTRSMWAGAAVGAMWLLGAKRPWMISLVPVAAAIVLALNPFQVRDRVMDIVAPQAGVLDTAAHRTVLRATGIEMMKAHPLFGVGPEQVESNFLEYMPATAPRPIPEGWYFAHLHNIYIHYAAERGIPALLFLLAFLGTALWDFGRGLRTDSSGTIRWVLHGSIASILAVMVSGYGEVNLGDSEVLGMFLGIVACGYAALGNLHRVATGQAPSS